MTFLKIFKTLNKFYNTGLYNYLNWAGYGKFQYQLCVDFFFVDRGVIVGL